MEIADVFDVNKLIQSGYTLTEEETEEFSKAMEVFLSEDSDVYSKSDVMNLSEVLFTAGRAYQAQFANDSVAINMDAETLTRFIQFLARGE